VKRGACPRAERNTNATTRQAIRFARSRFYLEAVTHASRTFPDAFMSGDRRYIAETIDVLNKRGYSPMLERELREIIDRLPAMRERLARAGTEPWTVDMDDEMQRVTDGKMRYIAGIPVAEESSSEVLQFIVEAHNSDVPDLIEAVHRLLEADAPSDSRPLKCCFTRCAGLVTFLTKLDFEWDDHSQPIKVPVCDMHGRILARRLEPETF
jgi:hypothetical protein